MERPYEYSRYEDDYRDYRDYRDRPIKRFQPLFRPRSCFRPRSRSPSLARGRRGNPRRRSRNQLWSYLRSKGENMKWDGEPTSKIEARVRELQQKETNKKVVYMVDADVLQSSKHKKMEVRFDNNKKASKKAKSKSDNEYSDQDQ
ncbi:hypothetical protein BTVI_00958 [Pitangus sulphuratus]|nr:hypothetical protein BTVI_00958 [Pitangus sulphuratus]